MFCSVSHTQRKTDSFVFCNMRFWKNVNGAKYISKTQYKTTCLISSIMKLHEVKQLSFIPRIEYEYLLCFEMITYIAHLLVIYSTKLIYGWIYKRRYIAWLHNEHMVSYEKHVTLHKLKRKKTMLRCWLLGHVHVKINAVIYGFSNMVSDLLATPPPANQRRC